MHIVKETDVLVTRMDLLLKRLDERAAKKEQCMAPSRPWIHI
jgi:hypothetical protein